MLFAICSCIFSTRFKCTFVPSFYVLFIAGLPAPDPDPDESSSSAPADDSSGTQAAMSNFDPRPRDPGTLRVYRTVPSKPFVAAKFSYVEEIGAELRKARDPK